MPVPAKGSPAMVKMLQVKPAQLDLLSAEAAKLSEADIVKLVTDGKGKMPSFKGKLDAEAVKSLAKFLVSLRKPAPAKPAEKPSESPTAPK